MAVHSQEAGAMTILSMRTLGLTAMVVFVTASAATAGREPTAAERAAVEEVLRAHGFESWEEIETDDGASGWEVNGARRSDGRKYDLELKFQAVGTTGEEPPGQTDPGVESRHVDPGLGGAGEDGNVDQSREAPETPGEQI